MFHIVFLLELNVAQLLFCSTMLIPFIKAINWVFDFVVYFLGLLGKKPFRKDKIYYYQGMPFSERLNKGKVEQIAKFEVHDSDIFLATYTRSGTHLTAELIDAILDNGDTTRLLNTHQEFRSPLIDLGHPLSMSPVMAMLLSLFGILQRGSRDISGYYKSRKPPRVFKTHLPIELIPRQLLAGKGKVVYVARNPLDTLVSNWKLTSSFAYTIYNSFDEFYEAFLSGEVKYGSWFDHVVGFWRKRENKNMLFLKFEDMKRDIRGVIRQLAEFLECAPLSDETVEKIVNHCSLKNMKGNVMTHPELFFPGSLLPKRKEGSFIRKGVVGDWKEEMTGEQAENIKQKYQEKVASQGLFFEFKNSQ